jgi:N-ATPase, AtpR subunit
MMLDGFAISIFVVLGSLLGIGYLSALKWNVQLYCDRDRSSFALSLHAVRFLGTSAIFVLIARIGAAPLLSVFAGFQFTRILVIRARLSDSVAAL